MAGDLGYSEADKTRLYDDDLYTDFDVVRDELNADLTSTPALAEALRTSQLTRRLPSTSTSTRQVSSTRRSRETVSGARAVPLGVFDHEGGGHCGPPLTAAHRAGYSSVSNTPYKSATPGTAGSGKEVTGPGPLLSTSSSVDPQIRNEDQPSGGGSATIWNRIRRLEKIVNVELDVSCEANARGDLQLALNHALVAQKEHHRLTLLREEYQATCTEFLFYGVGGKDRNKIASQMDLAFYVEFNLAIQYEANKMQSEALNTYNLIFNSKIYTNNGKLHLNVGNIYFNMENYEKAVKFYKMALDKMPKENGRLRMRILCNLAIAEFKLHHYESSLHSFEAIMAVEPSTRVGFSIIICLCCLGHGPHQLMDAFGNLLDVQFADDDSLGRHADDGETQSDVVSEAIRNDELNRLQQSERSAAENTVLQAAKIIAPRIYTCYEDAYDWCIQQVKKSRSFNSLVSQLDVDKAVSFLRSGDFGKVVDSLRTLEKRDIAVHGSASTSLAFLHRLTAYDDFRHRTGTGLVEGDAAGGPLGTLAERYAELAVKTDHYDPAALVNNGNLLMLRNDVEKARDSYREALQSDASCVEAMYNLGLVYKRQQLFNDALLCFNKLNVVLRNDAQVLYQLADVSELMGETQKAVEWFIQLLSVVPTDAGVLRRLGQLYDANGDQSQALHYFTDSHRCDPNHLPVIEWLGKYYVDSQLVEKALGFFQLGMLIEPSQPRWSLLVASCQRRAGNSLAALDIYRATHRRFPDHVDCLRLLTRLCIDLELSNEAQRYAVKLRRAEKAQRMRSSRGGATRPAVTSQGGPRGVDSVIQAMTDTVNPVNQQDDWPYVAVQANKSHGDSGEFPVDLALRRVQRPKSRLREVIDDFAGDIIGDDLLPT